MFLRNRHNPWLRLGMAVLAGLLFLVGYQWGNYYQRANDGPPTIQGVLLRPPVRLPELTLTDALGQAVDRDALGEHWTLLAFGDLAGASGQLAIQHLIDVYNRLGDRDELHQALRLVLVTNAEASRLGRDFMALSPALQVLGGTDAQIGPLRDALGAGPGDRQPIYVLAPGAWLVALLPDDESRAAMAEDVATLYPRAHWLLSEPEAPAPNIPPTPPESH